MIPFLLNHTNYAPETLFVLIFIWVYAEEKELLDWSITTILLSLFDLYAVNTTNLFAHVPTRVF